MAVTMICTMTLNAAAVDLQDIDMSEGTVVSREVLVTGEEATVTSVFNKDGSVTLLYKENEELLREYIVFPGSREYLQKDYTGVTVAQKRVVMDTTASASVNAQTRQTLDYEYWGTMSYYNPYMDETYSIRCEIAEVVNPDGSYSIVGYYVDRAAFIASVIGFFVAAPKALTEFAAKLFTTAKEKKILSVLVGGGIQVLHNIKVDAVITDYWIKGQCTKDPNKTGSFDGGYTAVVSADDAIFGKVEYSGIWTRDDWRNQTFGRLMFWEVYGVEYTPTSWT